MRGDDLAKEALFVRYTQGNDDDTGGRRSRQHRSHDEALEQAAAVGRSAPWRRKRGLNAMTKGGRRLVAQPRRGKRLMQRVMLAPLRRATRAACEMGFHLVRISGIELAIDEGVH